MKQLAVTPKSVEKELKKTIRNLKILDDFYSIEWKKNYTDYLIKAKKDEISALLENAKADLAAISTTPEVEIKSRINSYQLSIEKQNLQKMQLERFIAKIPETKAIDPIWREKILELADITAIRAAKYSNLKNLPGIFCKKKIQKAEAISSIQDQITRTLKSSQDIQMNLLWLKQLINTFEETTQLPVSGLQYGLWRRTTNNERQYIDDANSLVQQAKIITGHSQSR